jgi:putative ABC transport system substrate-binding protein
MLRVGFVGMQLREAPHYANFLRPMAELGYQEGRNFTFDYIQTPDVEGYDRKYRELAARNIDVFLAVGNEPALRATLSAAEGRPIAFLAVDFDPLARGVCDESVASGRQCDRYFRAPARTRRQARRDRS